MSQLGNGKTKTQDDPNVKILRELSNLPCNKNCFDCGQRGPTYVNITIGSFVCMTCSGLLRGLTPPHRVKSISMASFTLEEIDSLKSKGNEYCRKVWLATCTGNSLPGSEKDPDRVTVLRTFMSVKYEQKRYYIDPSKLSETELGKIQGENITGMTHSHHSVQKSPSVSSNKSFSCYQENKPSPTSKIRNCNQIALSQSSRLPSSSTLPNIKSLASLLEPKAPSVMMQEIDSKLHNTPMNFDKPNMADSSCKNFNGHVNTVENNRETNFANFEDAFSEKQLDSNNSNLFSNHSGTINNKSGCELTSDDCNNSTLCAKSMQIPILPYNDGNDKILSSSKINKQLCNTYYNRSANITTDNTSHEDKYAALKDLDSLFKQTANTTDVTAYEKGLPASASLPSNLSSSEWFNSGSNPFVQEPIRENWNSTNPYNPFAGNKLESTNGPTILKHTPISSTRSKINPFEVYTSISNPKNPFL